MGRAGPAFAALRDGGEVGAAGERARPMVDDALAALESVGVARERVVAATIFTTEGDVRLLREIAEVSEGAASPTITVESVRSGEELDVLFGAPSEDRPGTDVPSAEVDGGRSVVHDAIDFVVTGTFTGPRIVGGSGGDTGLLRRGDDGRLTAGPDLEQIPWTLVVPKGVDRADLPVVIAHHGNPGSMIFGPAIANTFARDGMAVEHVLGVAGVPVDGNAYFAALPPLEFPVTANLDTPGGTITAGGLVWSATHRLMLRKHDEVREEVPMYPPFQELDEPRAHVNPIEQAHDLALHFFGTRRTTGRAEIVDPASL